MVIKGVAYTQLRYIVYSQEMAVHHALNPHFSRNLKKRGEIGDLSRMVSGENPNQPTISP